MNFYLDKHGYDVYYFMSCKIFIKKEMINSMSEKQRSRNIMSVRTHLAWELTSNKRLVISILLLYNKIVES